MKLFITGASGYVGGSVAAALLADGHAVRGLARTDGAAAVLAARGIVPVMGTLDDADLLAAEARAADAVINAASSDHRPAIEALIAGLAGSGKPLLHTSGTSIVADRACGEPSDAVYDETTPFAPDPEKADRVAIDNRVRAAAGEGGRSVVLCNSLIYGYGLGAGRDSVQIPAIVAEARRTGVVHHVGRGLNIWSNVHIEDVVTLYRLALERAVPGDFLFVENGEACFRDVASAVAARLGLEPPVPCSIEAAIAAWGFQRAMFSLASNSRVRARRARALGWAPRHDSVLRWIAATMERTASASAS